MRDDRFESVRAFDDGLDRLRTAFPGSIGSDGEFRAAPYVISKDIG